MGCGSSDSRTRARSRAAEDLPEYLTVVGTIKDLRDIIRRLDVERVIICFSNDSVPQTLEVARGLHDLDVHVDVVPRLFELLGPRVVTHSVEGLTLIALPSTRLSRSSRQLKRTFDIAGASVALALTAPLFAYIAWRIKRDSPGLGVLPSDASRLRGPGVHGPEVPHDEGRRRQRGPSRVHQADDVLSRRAERERRVQTGTR